MVNLLENIPPQAIIRAGEFWHEDGWHENVDVSFSQGKVTNIQAINPSSETPPLDYSDKIIAPAPIDCQVNGGGGVLFNDDPSPMGLRKIVAAHLKEGTGLIFPTLFSPSYEQAAEAVNSINQALEEDWQGIGGLHLEGPFLNPIKAGAHDPSTIISTTPNQQWLDLMTKLNPKGRLIITLAPEIVGLKTIQQLVAQGIIVLLGHAQPSFDQAMAAFDAGAHGVTHLFNAMDGWIARQPGLAGAALMHPNAYCNVIMDGHHLHSATWDMIKKIKPQEKIIWVSDATSPVGTDLKSFHFGKDEVDVKNGGCYRKDGTLAGSAKSLHEIIKMDEGSTIKQRLSYGVINPWQLLQPKVSLRYACYA